MKKCKILILTLFLCVSFYSYCCAQMITTDIQDINIENDKIINAIFKFRPLDITNNRKIYFNFSHTDEKLNIYSSNEILYPPFYSLDFKNFKGGTITIKQFYDTDNNIIFFGITNNNYLFFNKYNYLIAVDKYIKCHLLCEPYKFEDLYNKNNPSYPMFMVYNNKISLELVNLAGKYSQKYVYIFNYDKDIDKFDIIDKGLIHFDFDALKRKYEKK